jgi:hypothetical protein
LFNDCVEIRGRVSVKGLHDIVKANARLYDMSISLSSLVVQTAFNAALSP